MKVEAGWSNLGCGGLDPADLGDEGIERGLWAVVVGFYRLTNGLADLEIVWADIL
jgi:hypothetical protein